MKSQMPRRRVGDDPIVPVPLQDKSALKAGNAAIRRYEAPARLLAHFAAFANGPWPARGAPPHYHRRFQARARTPALRHRSFSAASKRLRCGGEGLVNAD